MNITKYTDEIGEEAVIAHLLQNQDVDLILGRCLAHHFFDEFCRNMFTICMDYVQGVGNGKTNKKSVIDILQQLGKATPDAINYIEYLSTNSLTAYANIEYIITKLRDFAARRRFLMALEKSGREIDNVGNNVSEVLLGMEDDIASIERFDGTHFEIYMGDDLVKRRMKGIEQKRRTRTILTGWDDFDRKLTLGFSPKKMSVIGGRTSMGKSLWKTNLIYNMVKSGIGILSACPEQGLDSEQDRMDALETGMHLRKISRMSGVLDDDPMIALLEDSIISIAKNNYTVVPGRNLTVSTIRTAIRRARRAGKLVDVVFIDLFDRLTDVNVAKDRAGTISVKLGEIERIADEENVHMALLVQINRAPEGRKDKRPTLADLRDCGNYEQDADNVFLIYREGYYNKNITDDTMEIIIAKQRDGVAGIHFQFLISDKDCLRLMPMGEIKPT